MKLTDTKILTIAKKLKCIIYKGGKCLDCDCNLIEQPWAAHFHHRDKSKKLFQLSKYLSGNYSLHYVYEELQKCDLLCSICHTKIHYPLDTFQRYRPQIDKIITKLNFTRSQTPTKNDKELVTKLANEGKTLGEIYVLTGRTAPTIRKHLPTLKFGNQRSIKITNEQLHKELTAGKSLKEISQQYDLAYKTVWKRSKKLHC